MASIKTITSDRIYLDFETEIYEKLISKYGDLGNFIDRLKSFVANLSSHKDEYNINPYTDKINRGIYILGKDDRELEIFPDPHLALKCSQNKPLSEDLKKQFDRSIQLIQDFENKFNETQKDLLQICPIYLYVKINSASSFFKQILFMKRVAGGKTLGDTKSGFSDEFCQNFQIPTLAEIAALSQFSLHRYIDRNKQRQLLKIQTAYLFHRLWLKGIRIFSLNQKNIRLYRT